MRPPAVGRAAETWMRLLEKVHSGGDAVLAPGTEANSRGALGVHLLSRRKINHPCFRLLRLISTRKGEASQRGKRKDTHAQSDCHWGLGMHWCSHERDGRNDCQNDG